MSSSDLVRNPGGVETLAARLRRSVSIIVLLPIFLIICPRVSFPWSSFTIGALYQTHQYILRQAYALLEKDPAFYGNQRNQRLFPSLDDILAHEGIDLAMRGLGPDAAGSSYFSNHYYNPRLEKAEYSYDPALVGKDSTSGFAPDMVRSNFMELANHFYETALNPRNISSLPAKNAAWGAHFLADLSVPFHVNGCWFPYLERLLPHLGNTIAGPLSVLSHGMVSEHPDDFTEEIRLYKDAHKKDEKADWFDPWYYNGDPVNLNALPKWAGIDVDLSPSTKASSHVLWEARILPDNAFKVSGLPGAWKNPKPGFFGASKDAFKDQGVQAMEYAKSEARYTVDNLLAFVRHPEQPLMRSIQNVYSFWRASISGLQLEVSQSPAVDPNDPACDNAYRFTVSVRNTANVSVGDVKVRAVAVDGKLLHTEIYPFEQEMKNDIGANELTLPTFQWIVEPSAQDCSVVFEAIGSYQIPDLQYTVAVQSAPAIATLGVSVIDAQAKTLVPGAEVSIAGRKKAAAKTDDKGKVDFHGLALGNYIVTATASGYSAGTMDLSIDPLAEGHFAVVLSLNKAVSPAPAGSKALEILKEAAARLGYPWEAYHEERITRVDKQSGTGFMFLKRDGYTASRDGSGAGYDRTLNLKIDEIQLGDGWVRLRKVNGVDVFEKLGCDYFRKNEYIRFGIFFFNHDGDAEKAREQYKKISTKVYRGYEIYERLIIEPPHKYHHYSYSGSGPDKTDKSFDRYSSEDFALIELVSGSYKLRVTLYRDWEDADPNVFKKEIPFPYRELDALIDAALSLKAIEKR